MALAASAVLAASGGVALAAVNGHSSAPAKTKSKTKPRIHRTPAQHHCDRDGSTSNAGLGV